MLFKSNKIKLFQPYYVFSSFLINWEFLFISVDGEGLAHYVIVATKSNVGQIGSVVAKHQVGETDSFDFEVAHSEDSAKMTESLRLTMDACRIVLNRLELKFHIEIKGGFKLEGASFNAPAALAVFNLVHPSLKTDGILATGRFEYDSFHGVGDIDEKALTAERYKLKFVYPKENTDINETIRRDCDITPFENMGELFNLLKVNIENWQISLSNNFLLFYFRLYSTTKFQPLNRRTT